MLEDTGYGYYHGHQLHKHDLEKEEIVNQDVSKDLVVSCVWTPQFSHHLGQQVCKNLSLPW